MMTKMKTYQFVCVLTLLIIGTSASNSQRSSDQDITFENESSTVVSTVKYNHDVISAINSTKPLRRHYAKKRSKITNDYSKAKKERDGSRNWFNNDFIMTDSLPDGERQIRIHYNGTFAKQTSAIENGEGLILRQVSNGKQFIQMIYSSENKLLDCEFVQKNVENKKFRKNFKKEITNYNGVARKKSRKQNVDDCRTLSYANRWRCRKNSNKHFKSNINDDLKEYYERQDDYEDYENTDLITDNTEFFESKTMRQKRGKSKRDQSSDESFKRLKNVTINMLESGSSLPQHLADWVDLTESKKQCDALHERVYRNMYTDSENNNKRIRRSQESLVIFPGTLWCGKGDVANSYSELGPKSETDVCCRVHDHCPLKVRGLDRSIGLFNNMPYTVTHCVCDSRRSRVGRSIVLFPGTKWCGKGSEKVSMNELGEFGAADRCCRLHDNACPYWVESMSKKYGMINLRPNTLMQCRCDERFRTCLKMANTDVSNMVGKIFFNIVQTKCFVLKSVKLCKKRTWWGKCTKKGLKKQAFIIDNLRY